MSTNVATSLLDKLREKQTKEGLSNRQFALVRLGVSPELWRKTLKGERRIGTAITKGTLNSYPELGEDVLKILHGDVDVSSTIGEYSTTPPVSSPKRFLGGLGGKVIDFLRSLFPRG